MSIVLYILFFVLGFFAVSNEIFRKKTSLPLFFLLSVLFLMILCSRIGHDKDYNDLNSYISYFQNDDDKYFEPGYVVFVGLIKTLFGYGATAYVSCVGVFELFFLLLSYLIIVSNEKKVLFLNHQNKNAITKKNNYGLIVLFYVFSLYWGTAFGCEVIRLGIAISILFCSFALAITGRKVLSLFLLPLAFSFQYTSVIFLIGILALFFSKRIKKQHLWIIFVSGIFIDFFYVFGIFSYSIGELFLSKVLSYGEIFSHYDAYSGTIETTLSLQYFAYHIFGFLMLHGNFSDEKYKGAVIIYILGLFIGTLFNGSVFSMRLQWVFLPSVIFVLYFFAKDVHYSSRTKLIFIGAFSLVEAVMAVRYLGCYV